MVPVSSFSRKLGFLTEIYSAFDAHSRPTHSFRKMADGGLGSVQLSRTFRKSLRKGKLAAIVFCASDDLHLN